MACHALMTSGEETEGNGRRVQTLLRGAAAGNANAQAAEAWALGVVDKPGGDLLSRGQSALSSARRRFTVLFGMGRRGSSALLPPGCSGSPCRPPVWGRATQRCWGRRCLASPWRLRRPAMGLRFDVAPSRCHMASRRRYASSAYNPARLGL